MTGSSQGEISAMVVQFNTEMEGWSTDVHVEQPEFGETDPVIGTGHRSRKDGRGDRGTDDKAEHQLGRSDVKSGERMRRSSRVSEMTEVYEGNLNRNLDDESSENESNIEDNNTRDYVTITYDENRKGNFEQFEFGGGELDTAEEQEFIENESLLSGVPFSDGESEIEAKESSDSESDRQISREAEFQYTADTNFLPVKNLKKKFDNNI